MKKINTTAGALEEVTLDEFLEVVRTSMTDNQLLQYNSQTSHAIFDKEETEDSTYTREVIQLQNPTLDNIMHQILDQTTRHVFSGTKERMIEDAAVTSLENFGSPTHLVQIHNNLYGVFCEEDFFAKVHNIRKAAVVCTAPLRNVVFGLDDGDFIFEKSGAV